MKKVMLFLFLILFLACVSAEDKIIKTTITNITVETWIQDNESHYRIFFDSENIEEDEPSYFEKTGAGNFSDINKTIRFIRNLECNTTSESLMLDYFEECEYGGEKKSCKESFLECDSEKKYFENLSVFYNPYIDCINAKAILYIDYDELRDSYYNNMTEMNSTIYQLNKERDSAKSWQLGVAIITFICVVGYYNLRERFGKTKEEGELGIDSGSVGKRFKFFRNLLKKGPSIKDEKEEEWKIE